MKLQSGKEVDISGIDGFKLTSMSFVSLLVIESSSLDLPVIEATLLFMKKDFLKDLHDKKIEVKMEDESWKCKVINVTSPSIDKEVIPVTITMIEDLPVHKNKIRAKKGTSKDAINSLSVEKDLRFSPSDSMTWIQHETDHHFAKRTIRNSHISKETFALGAYTGNKLVVVDVKKEQDKSKKKYSFDDRTGDLVYNSVEKITDRSFISAFGENRGIDTLDVTKRDEYKSFNKESRKLAPFLYSDKKAIHDHYKESELNNLSLSNKFFGVSVIVTLGYYVDHKVLDSIEVITKETSGGQDSIVSNKYLITERRLSANVRSIQTKLICNRLEK